MNFLEVGNKSTNVEFLISHIYSHDLTAGKAFPFTSRIRSTLIKSATKPRQPTYRIQPVHDRDQPLEETREPSAQPANPRHAPKFRGALVRHGEYEKRGPA
jgi:cell division protein FtsN